MGITEKILNYILGGTSLLLGLALAGTIAFYTGKDSSLQKSFDAATARADANAKNTGTLQGGLDVCNATVAAWKADGEARTAAADKAAQAARDAAKAAQTAAANVLKAKPGPDLCKSSDALIMEHVQ